MKQKRFCENLFWSIYLYIVYKVKSPLTDSMFKNKASWMHLFVVIMKRNELFVTVSTLASIISFIFLNILFVFIRWEHNPFVLSVLLQYTDSDYPFGIFKLPPPPFFPHSLNVKWLVHCMCCDFINSFEDCVPNE
jgi:hypothetical protein